jgi:hypothetical protein
MELGKLNTFISYEDKPLWHEDQLTRAFLILVRAAKPVEMLLLTMLRDAMRAAKIDNVPKTMDEALGGVESVETQVRSTTKARLQGESGRLVSVIITDAKLDPEHTVERTSRVAVYDGFVKYRPDWVFVIENKPRHENIWVAQLSSAFNENYEVEPTPVVLTWTDIITRLGILLSNGLLQDAGRILTEDFLAYVSSYFPELNPYHRFGLCGANEYLLSRRCLTAMADVALGPVEYHRGWHHSIRLENKPGIKEVALYPQTDPTGAWEIRLDLHPGDTMSQARHLYSSIDLRRLRDLPQIGWSVVPNFHLAYRSSNLYWAENDLMPVLEYVDYWVAEISHDRLHQIVRDEWQSCFDRWVKDRILSERDVRRFNAEVGQTRIPTLNVCPGINLRYAWPGDSAISLDDDDSFLPELNQRIRQATGIW